MTSARPSILLLGPTGQIGRELTRAPRGRGAPDDIGGDVVALDRRRLDLRDTGQLRRRLREIRPDLVLNAAGYTAVDLAEEKPEAARVINAAAPGVLAEECAGLGAALVHFSTDYVFDGTRRTPYGPDDAPAPINVYGRTKHEGELAIARAGAAALVIRTSWVYGHHGRNFLDAVLRRAEAGEALRVVDDQLGSPTWSRAIAEATVDIVTRSLVRGAGGWSFGGREGTYHVAASGETTWYRFARRIFASADLDPLPRLAAISTEEYDAAALRPAYSVLDSSKARDVFGVEIGPWETPVAEVVRLRVQRAANPLPGSPR